MDKILYLKALREKQIRSCRNSFWEFCKTLSPTLKDGKKFFDEDKQYLKEIATELQDLVEDKNPKLKGICISIPPRHGKSLMAQYFNAWLIGKNNNIQIANISYSPEISKPFSRNVRNMVSANSKYEDLDIEYQDIFPGIEISKDQK